MAGSAKPRGLCVTFLPGKVKQEIGVDPGWRWQRRKRLPLSED